MVSSTPRLHFTPGKDPVPNVQEAGWVPGPVWTGGMMMMMMIIIMMMMMMMMMIIIIIIIIIIILSPQNFSFCLFGPLFQKSAHQ